MVHGDCREIMAYTFLEGLKSIARKPLPSRPGFAEARKLTWHTPETHAHSRECGWSVIGVSLEWFEWNANPDGRSDDEALVGRRSRG